MKTTIQRVKIIKFTKKEQRFLKELWVNLIPKKELIIDDKTAKKYINNLIEINPTKQEHKDFIMELIKELKR